MPVQRKVFRIEETMTPVGVTATVLDGVSQADYDEIIAELKALHELLDRRDSKPRGDIESAIAAELQRLKAETEAIHVALNRTKQEIAALHVSAFGSSPVQVTRELDAVVDSAERATQQILSAAEDIEDAANTLSASLRNEQEKSLALDIRDSVLRVFEACNFQDLTGQRIAKVLTTLKFVEERVATMIDIWGGIDAFKIYAAAAEGEINRSSLLHGPKLDGEEGHVSQDDVDAIFAAG